MANVWPGPSLGGCIIDGKWSVCCCALLDVYQNEVSNNPIVPLPKVHNITTKINGLTLQQPFLEQVGLCETIHSRQDVGYQQSSHQELSCMSACKTFLAVELLLWINGLYSRTAARNQLNCRGSRPHSRMTHYEGVVSLTIRILLSTSAAISVKDCPFLCPVLRMGWPKLGLHTYQQELLTF